MRRLASALPLVQLDNQLMASFFCFKQKLEQERMKEEDDDEGEDDEDEEEEEDSDDILNKMQKTCKKKKDTAGLALVAVTRHFAEKNNWEASKTEESFIDQHLFPLLHPVFLNDSEFDYSRSAGRIRLTDSSLTASKDKDSCLMLKPDFLVTYEYKGCDVGLLAVEVKPPNACSSQTLSDRSKLGLELKRMVDEQVVQGSFEPKSFGILVEGFECTFFTCTLEKSGCYLYAELDRKNLLQSSGDLMLLPDLVCVLCRVKTEMVEAKNKLIKKQKTSGEGLRALIKPTVGLPTKITTCT
ncbi:hypothetical protein EDC96DRAFT_513318 [Choanephora cucurbitarum]|nr:hypothetical protein EDC96DRAFT_513318 [Choanephora cucurbitarum]